MDEETIGNGATEDEFDLAFNVAVGTEPEKEDVVVEDAPVKDEPVSDEPKKVESEKAEPEKVEPIVPKVDPTKVAQEAETVRLVQEAKTKADADAKAEADRQQAESLAREALTPEEQVALKEVEDNFSDTALALKAVERIAFAKAENAFNTKLKVLEEKFEQKFSQMGQDFAPAIATAKVVAKDAHEAAILKGHADAFDIVGKVEEWANTKPDFLKLAYNEVLDHGNSGQIVELFTIFKKERDGSEKGPPTSTPTPEDTAQTAAKEKKLRSLEGVRSRQAAQKGGIDEDDFESAFKAAANS